MFHPLGSCRNILLRKLELFQTVSMSDLTIEFMLFILTERGKQHIWHLHTNSCVFDLYVLVPLCLDSNTKLLLLAATFLLVSL